MTLQDYLAAREDRCPQCGYNPEIQGCACAGQRLKFKGQAIATNAHPADRAKVEAAIRQLAATGRPFTANEARLIHGVKGPVVGATFGALKSTGVIKPHESDEPLPRSTAKSTNGHHLFRWIGAAA